MRLAAALLLLLAAPAVAQVSTSNTTSAVATAQFGRTQGQDSNLQFRDRSRLSRFEPVEDTIRRAGAWGECVAAAAPADSRSYLASQRTTSLLRWSFERCQRKVGQFDGAGMGSIRRAALIDALRVAG